jgi:hypothetical protein
MGADFTRVWYIAGRELHFEGDFAMDEERNNNGGEFEDEDEQIEQMIIENGILLHSLAALLVRKGVLKQEEIDAEMDRLYDEMENFDQQ